MADELSDAEALTILKQKIDVIAVDTGKAGPARKKALWQLSDESEASLASADDDDANEDEDEDDDASVDSDGGGGGLAARKPRPAKLVAVTSNDAERRQQRQVTYDLRVELPHTADVLLQDDLRFEDSRRMRELMSALHMLADAKVSAAAAPSAISSVKSSVSSAAASASASSLAAKATPARATTAKPRFSSGGAGAGAVAGTSSSGRR